MGDAEETPSPTLRPLDVDDRTWGDERGWGLRLLEAAGLHSDEVGDLHVVSLRPGAVRGNHVHEQGTEWLLVCGGPAVAAWRARGAEEGAHARMEIPGDRPALLEIPPGVPHALQNAARHPIHLVAVNEEAEPPTRKVEPLL